MRSPTDAELLADSARAVALAEQCNSKSPDVSTMAAAIGKAADAAIYATLHSNIAAAFANFFNATVRSPMVAVRQLTH